MARSLIRTAAQTHGLASRQGLLERLFAHLFEGLVYPQIWEDPLVDMEALAIGPATRMVAIASGGCNVMSYLTAGPARLLAVDLNRHHIALLRLKLAAARHLPDHAAFSRLLADAADPGNPALYRAHLAGHLDPATRLYWDEQIHLLATGFYRTGLLGRTIGMAHLLVRLHGGRLRHVLEARTLAEQQAAYEREVAPVFRSPLVKALVRLPVAYFGLGIPPAQLAAMRADAGGDLLATCEARVRRLLTGWPLAENYFARQALARGYGPAGALPPYLEARHFATLGRHADRVEPRLASLTEALAAEPAASLDAYVLLDAQDWMSRAQITGLWAEIGRTAAPGARVIFRTAAAASPLEPMLPPELLQDWTYAAETSARLHAADRSAIYGGFHLYRRRSL